MRYFFLFIVFVMLTGPGCVSDPKAGQDQPWSRTANEVICRVDGEPDAINSLLTSSRYTVQICEQIFAYLMYFDPYALELVPQLVKAQPEVSDITDGTNPYQGGKAYTFEIHETAVWDDGKPITGNDYVFTLKALFHPMVQAQRYRPYLTFVRDVEVDADNPRKFRVITLDPPSQAIERLGNAVPLFPAHHYDPESALEKVPLTTFLDAEAITAVVESDEALQSFAERFASPEFTREPKNIMGAGPYRVEQLATGQPTILVKKENWWGDALADQYAGLRAYPERLVYKTIVDEASVTAALKSEEIDAVSDLAPQDFLNLRESPALQNIYNFHSPPLLAVYLIYLNTRNPKLSDKRVRRALALSTDVSEIIDALYSGMAQQAVTSVHPLDQYFNDALPPIEYNPEKARELLAAAGWTDTNQNGIVDKEINGERLEMSLTLHITAENERSRSVGIILQEQMKQSGVEINLQALAFNELISNQKSGNYELSFGGRSLAPTDWEPKQNYYSSGDNRTGFGTVESDQLIDELQKTVDKTKRAELYDRIQEIIYDEQPEIYLVVTKGRLVTHKRFEMEPSIIHPGFFPQYFKIKEAK